MKGFTFTIVSSCTIVFLINFNSWFIIIRRRENIPVVTLNTVVYSWIIFFLQTIESNVNNIEKTSMMLMMMTSMMKMRKRVENITKVNIKKKNNDECLWFIRALFKHKSIDLLSKYILTILFCFVVFFKQNALM